MTATHAAAATAAGLLFRDLAIDFPLNVSIVKSYADAGKPGAVIGRIAQAAVARGMLHVGHGLDQLARVSDDLRIPPSC
ncbi:hypothetical protein [Nocardioides sp. B-3]|uniref:hypothetical protein n=1 Tax=Nocardioides sp. B-3 TaxID=2895565 RepID=UPI0021538339|nr:hypothetical protein [Nocardioides sp. B-3]UUZ60362.1 hypothetical protein LP418_05490 [Nocardioides sp. B-3]